jgi:hypothetical protein
MFRDYPYGKLPLSKRNRERKLRRLIGFTMDTFLKLDLICFHENKGIADLIEEFINQRWDSEEKEIVENIDTKLAQLRFSNVIRKLVKVKVPKTKQPTYRTMDLIFEE